VTDTFLWYVPYWNADGTLVLGLDALHPARISLPVLMPTGVEESLKPEASSFKPAATVVRGVLWLSAKGEGRMASRDLLDIAGRQVMALHPGANDVRILSSGIYFVRSEASAVLNRRVVITK